MICPKDITEKLKKKEKENDLWIIGYFIFKTKNRTVKTLFLPIIFHVLELNKIVVC